LNKLIELYYLLQDGTWEALSTEELGKEVQLEPDPVIHRARLALDWKGDLEAALQGLELQLRGVKRILRAVRYDLVEVVQSERGDLLEWVPALTYDLCQLSALIQMRLQRWNEARENLNRAIICKPESKNPSFHLVELYRETGHFLQAFELLDRTFGNVDLPDRFIQLYRLASDILTRGDREAARTCYQRLSTLEHAGFFSELAKLQLQSLDSGHSSPPSSDELASTYNLAGDHFLAKRYEAAMQGYLQVLRLAPTLAQAWYFLAQCQFMLVVYPPTVIQVEQEAAMRLWDGHGSPEQYEELELAAKTFAVTVRLETRFPRAYADLARCYVLLKHPERARMAAELGLDNEPNSAYAHAIFAQACLLNHDIQGAEEAVQRALELDPKESTALDILPKLAQARKSRNR
jgi:tetratricopeptide (TPR) repeat protein